MRVQSGRDGKSSLIISHEEIETRMQMALRTAGLYPSESSPVVDIVAFVEKHLKVRVDEYDELPPEVLGYTEFYPNKRPRIFINRDLTEEAMDNEDSPTWLKGRWRCTMAHEASHVILHRALFTGRSKPRGADTPAGGGAAPVAGIQRCLKRDVQFGGKTFDAREVQANRGMAALLMPKALVCALCAAELGTAGFAAGLRKGTPDAEELIRTMADRFEVSRQASAIRLETLGIVVPAVDGVRV